MQNDIFLAHEVEFVNRLRQILVTLLDSRDVGDVSLGIVTLCWYFEVHCILCNCAEETVKTGALVLKSR